jgi:hypothetical protein
MADMRDKYNRDVPRDTNTPLSSVEQQKLNSGKRKMEQASNAYLQKAKTNLAKARANKKFQGKAIKMNKNMAKSDLRSAGIQYGRVAVASAGKTLGETKNAVNQAVLGEVRARSRGASAGLKRKKIDRIANKGKSIGVRSGYGMRGGAAGGGININDVNR